MKRIILNPAWALLSATLLALTSCSTKPPGDATSVTTTQKGVPGGTVVDTYKVTATVTAVDAASRRLTLETRDGATTTVKAGPEVANFDQIQIGDHVKARVAQRLVVFVRNNGEPANDGAAAAVALAPIGAKPGVLMADTEEVTAKVQALDLKNRQATLRFPDESTRTFLVRKDVDMTKAKLGDEVVFRITEALAITVEKP